MKQTNEQHQELERLVKEFYDDIERDEKKSRETLNEAIDIVHRLMIKFDELLEIMRKLNGET